jgi:hypothetical protein
VVECEFDEPTLNRGWLVHEAAPSVERITLYDQCHFLTYARLLDAERAGLNWREAATDILLCDVQQDPESTRRCWQSHLTRAHWVVGGAR